MAERNQRVSVRLSREEESQLQQRAAEAGVTVSQYLRRCALGDQPAQQVNGVGILALEQPSRQSASSSADAAKPSGFGEWITLLRNRFLSSQTRFAERA